MAVMLVVSFTLILGRLIFAYRYLATLSILCFKVSQVDLPNKCLRQSLNIAFIIANSAASE